MAPPLPFNVKSATEARLMWITPPGASLEQLRELAPLYVRLGGRTVQWRSPAVSPRQLVELIGSVAGHSSYINIVNDRLDVALVAKECGVHLKESSIPLPRVRQAAPEMLLGASRHDLDGALRAESDGADYLMVGPVFSPRSKPETSPPLGTKGFRTIAESVAIPVIAVGGMTPENISDCLDAGAAGVAVIGSLNTAERMRENLPRFLDALTA